MLCDKPLTLLLGDEMRERIAIGHDYGVIDCAGIYLSMLIMLFGWELKMFAIIRKIAMQFKEKHSFEERKAQSKRLLKKHPDRVPVVVERAPSGTFVAELENSRYLLAYDATVGGFMATLRKQVVTNASDGFYMFCGNKRVLVSGSNTFQHLYACYKDDDGFLYMLYAGENVFG